MSLSEMLRRRKAVERVRTQQFAESIDLGLELIPERVLERIGAMHFFEGDLFFAGGYNGDFFGADHYMSAMSPNHFRHQRFPADQQVSTVCFTGNSLGARRPTSHAVIHEAAHCLQYALGSYPFDWGWPWYNIVGLPDLCGNITVYGEDVYCEQFSEAMVAWLATPDLLWSRYAGSPERLLENGPELLAFFNELAGFPTDRLPRALR